jgi:hypothetical protein
MRRTALPLLTLALAACGGGTPPPSPEPVVQVDTIMITREVEPPLPEGRPATVCLASGENVDILISAAGDTLIGPRRVALSDLGPGVSFVGDYAADESWFVADDAVTFDRRAFRKFGQPSTRDCRDLKIVGDHTGVNLFAESDASAPFGTLLVPVRPGVFQPYQAQVGAVRG